MRIVSITIILCHLLLVCEPALSFQQKPKDMEVTLVRQNSLVANKGNNHGISVGTLYDIRQDGYIIGTAEVKVVKSTMCGLKIVTIEPDYKPRVGDTLTLSGQVGVEQQSILSEMQEIEFAPEKLRKVDQPKYDSPSDYYFVGKEAADNAYGSAFGGGLAAGFLGGLIGWGIGYAIVSGKGAEVPAHHLVNLNPDERLQFNSGYKEKIKSKRKSTFNAGALTGTLIIVAIIVAANSSQ